MEDHQQGILRRTEREKVKSTDFKSGIPSFWTIQSVGWIVYLAAVYITFLTVAPPERFLYLFYLKAFRALTGFALTSFFLRPAYKLFDGRLSIASLVILVLTAAVVFGAVWTAVEGVFVYLTSFPFDIGSYLARSPRIALDYAMTLTAWSALYLGAKHWFSWQDAREEALSSEVAANRAQLEMLRYQINPHFLFNALNSIRASVDEDADRAKRMTTQMSEFLRYSLLAEMRTLIPLREEIEAVRNYLAIEKIRFEDEIEIAFDVGRNCEDIEVPCFVLTPLVDNAVKHGMKTSPKPLRINVSARLTGELLSLEVSNSGRFSPESGDGGTGIGLKNVGERLSRFFGSGASLDVAQDNDKVRARINIPYETHGDHR